MTQTPQRRIHATRSEQLPRSGLVQGFLCKLPDSLNRWNGREGLVLLSAVEDQTGDEREAPTH